MVTVRSVTLTALVVGMALVASCGSEGGEPLAEQQLVDGFVTPLRDAGLAVEVVSTCHYPARVYPPPAEPTKRTLVAHLTVDAGSERVGEVLAGESMVVSAASDGVVLQQFPGQPRRGWSGGMDPGEGPVRIDLVKNGVDVTERDDLAWMPVCPESIPRDD